MHIAVYGSGYLGTVVSACLADFGNPVLCFDDHNSQVEQLAQGRVPFYEKDLTDMVRRNVRAGRLTFTCDPLALAGKAQVIYMADDSYRYVEEAALRVVQHAGGECIVVLMTPVPVGTAGRVQQRLNAAGRKAEVVSQPMFLTDGWAVEDFNWPDRIVLGASSPQAALTLKQIYRPLVMRGVPVLVTSFETAELVREASTAFIATKISFINEVAGLCERVGADAVDLAMAMGLDKKIGPRCLQPGAALGGAFVEHDLESLGTLAAAKGVSLKILGAARLVNAAHCDRILDKLSAMLESVRDKEIGLLGMAFKPHTNSVALSSSIQLARRLVAGGARVRAYDPVAMADARAELNGSVRYCDTPYAAAEGADALVLATGWPEFRTLDFMTIRRSLRRPVIVDTKNLLDGARLRAMGFEYAGIGRG